VTVRRSIGRGRRGLVDGTAAEAGFSEPNGLVVLPAEVAASAGYDVVVADTVNHALRGVRLEDGSVRTLAGTGEPWMPGDDTARMSSPWDVAWWRDRVWVAMAGIHQLWTYDPATREVAVAAGTTNEGLVDGPAAQAWLAQPSRLAPDADRLWIADAETSALRRLSADGDVETAIGTGLFDFGFVDGPAGTALLQHPLGVAALPDGTVAVCDSYNGAVRRYDPATGVLTTLATGLAEPSAAVVVGDQLLVVESAAHRLTRMPLGATATAGGGARRTHRPVTEVAGGDVELQVVFDPPPGQQVDDRFGPATQVVVEATPPQLVTAGDGRGTGLVRTLTLDPHVGAVSCTWRPGRPPARPTAVPERRATCTSRTGACRCGSRPTVSDVSPWCCPRGPAPDRALVAWCQPQHACPVSRPELPAACARHRSAPQGPRTRVRRVHRLAGPAASGSGSDAPRPRH
jgi:hypothetical protein